MFLSCTQITIVMLTNMCACVCVTAVKIVSRRLHSSNKSAAETTEKKEKEK
jgi:hypothetical protein